MFSQFSRQAIRKRFAYRNTGGTANFPPTSHNFPQLPTTFHKLTLISTNIEPIVSQLLSRVTFSGHKITLFSLRFRPAFHLPPTKALRTLFSDCFSARNRIIYWQFTSVCQTILLAPFDKPSLKVPRKSRSGREDFITDSTPAVRSFVKILEQLRF